VTERDFDIWLHGFAAETREAPPLALSRVFGIPQPAAEALLATLPRVIRRDASAEQAERIVQALESIGGQAEAVPTRVVPAPVLLVGTHTPAKQETIVRHGPRSAERRSPEQREQSVLGGVRRGSTLRLGTQELEAFFKPPAPPAAVQAGPAPWLADLHDTLIQPPPPWAEPEVGQQVAEQAPPHASQQSQPAPVTLQSQPAPVTVQSQPAPVSAPQWSDLSLAPPLRVSVQAPGYPESLRPHASTVAMGAPRLLDATDLIPGHPSVQLDEEPDETIDPLAEKPKAASLKIMRNVHEWLESTQDLPGISLAPPSSRPPPNIGPQPPSKSPTAWQNPMALPGSKAPPANIGMRPATERGRSARARSQRPPSMRPRAQAPTGPSLGEALAMALRGEGRQAARAYPSLAFAIVLVMATLAFTVAYAAF